MLISWILKAQEAKSTSEYIWDTSIQDTNIAGNNKQSPAISTVK